MTAPIVKWAGGKRKILPQLAPHLPDGVERLRHVEPFAGGAAMFFAGRPRSALLGDVNRDLINAYVMVRDFVEDVIVELDHHAMRHDETHYYRTRDRYNELRRDGIDQLGRAAMFIYLNKTCFNGLHRVNRKGDFNVPAGRYKNPSILDADGLRAASVHLQHAYLFAGQFDECAELVTDDDFVYFDPPYEPLSRTSSFTSYAKDGFGQDDQCRLRDVFEQLTSRGIPCMLSNSSAPFILDLYRDFPIDFVDAPLAMNSDASKRGAVKEIVVRNYVPRSKERINPDVAHLPSDAAGDGCARRSADQRGAA